MRYSKKLRQKKEAIDKFSQIDFKALQRPGVYTGREYAKKSAEAEREYYKSSLYNARISLQNWKRVVATETLPRRKEFAQQMVEFGELLVTFYETNIEFMEDHFDKFSEMHKEKWSEFDDEWLRVMPND